jgi:hypothetical protein
VKYSEVHQIIVELRQGIWESGRMKTPVRPVRIDDTLWKAAQRVAEDLQRETGLSATASDVVRKALSDYIDRWRAAKRTPKTTH